MLILYGANLSGPSNKVRFTANILELDYEYRQVSIRKGENKTPEFLSLHPAGKIPVIDDDGFVLFESNVICKYLLEKTPNALYPKELKTRSLVDQWIDFISLHIGAAVNKVAYNRIFVPLIRAEVDERALAEGLGFLNRFLPIVENQLTKRKYVAGETLSLADLNLLSTLDPAETAKIELAGYPRLSAWRSALQNEEFYRKCHTSYDESFRKFLKR